MTDATPSRKPALLIAVIIVGIIAAGAVAYLSLRGTDGGDAAATEAEKPKKEKKDKKEKDGEGDAKGVAKLEKELERAYEDVLAVHKDKKKFTDQQKEWLADTRKRCDGDDKCLKREYKERIDRLGEIARKQEAKDRK